MKSLSVWARKNISALIHPQLRSFILRHVNLLDSRTEWWRSQDPYLNEPPYSTYESKYPVKLGIVREFWHRHWPYIAACRDLGVAYRVIDISGSDWIEAVKESKCDAFLIWPSVQISIWKQMYDERLRIIVENLGKVIYPTYNELWLYESKRRMYYWLKANALPCAKTWVFYREKEALEFALDVSLPIVAKTNIGARASGVHVFRSMKCLQKHIKRCFKNGIVHSDGEARDREWGFVYLQEYLPDVAEWRVIRLGDSYFAHQKVREGDFHSGTRKKKWLRPPNRLLDIVREISDNYSFTSMDFEIFETPNGHYLLNELQTFFGAHTDYQMLIDGVSGRYIYDYKTLKWHFEEGIFNQNSSCNLRVKYLLSQLSSKTGLVTSPNK